jgi:phosphate-selective porin
VIGRLAAAWIIAVASTGHAQSADTASPHRDGYGFDSRWLSLRPGAALVVDASGYAQNDASTRQVGDLATVGRFRYARAIVSGAIKLRRPVAYLVSVDASGLYADHKPVLTMTDLAATIPIGGHGHIAIGRQKEGLTEQITAASRGIAFAERAAPVTAFVPIRNDGIRLWGSIPNTHAGWTVGAFNDALFNGRSLRANGYQISGRVFYAPIVSADSNRALQIALDARWRDASQGALDYKSKPENNEAPNFVNTMPFVASSGLTGDAELLALHDNLSFNAELLPTQALGTATGTATFIAYYAALSWRPHGEARPDDEDTGTLGRVRSGRRKGVWEVAARFSHTDLTSGAQQGGVLDIPSASIGVWGPSSTRILVDGGFSILRKGSVTGRAALVTARVQWELR